MRTCVHVRAFVYTCLNVCLCVRVCTHALVWVCVGMCDSVDRSRI